MAKTDLRKYMQLMMGEDGVSFIVKGGGLLTEASGYLNYHTHSCVLANPKSNLQQNSNMYYFW